MLDLACVDLSLMFCIKSFQGLKMDLLIFLLMFVLVPVNSLEEAAARYVNVNDTATTSDFTTEKVFIGLGAVSFAAFVSLALCIAGWAVVIVLLCKRRSGTSTAYQIGPCHEGGSQHHPTCSSLHTLDHLSSLTPTPDKTTKESVFNFPVGQKITPSKSDLSAIICSGKQATTRFCQSTPELDNHRVNRVPAPPIMKCTCYAIRETSGVPPNATQSNPHLQTCTCSPAQNIRKLRSTGWEHPSRSQVSN